MILPRGLLLARKSKIDSTIEYKGLAFRSGTSRSFNWCLKKKERKSGEKKTIDYMRVLDAESIFYRKKKGGTGAQGSKGGAQKTKRREKRSSQEEGLLFKSVKSKRGGPQHSTTTAPPAPQDRSTPGRKIFIRRNL